MKKNMVMILVVLGLTGIGGGVKMRGESHAFPLASGSLNVTEGKSIESGNNSLKSSKLKELEAFKGEVIQGSAPIESATVDSEEVPLDEEIITEEDDYLWTAEESEDDFVIDESEAVFNEPEDEEHETETYDQQTQRETGELDKESQENFQKNKEMYYSESDEEKGIVKISQFLEDEYSFIIPSNPSGNIYQYDIYEDSPDGISSSLVGIFQYDAVNENIFKLDIVSGKWEKLS